MGDAWTLEEIRPRGLLPDRASRALVAWGRSLGARAASVGFVFALLAVPAVAVHGGDGGGGHATPGAAADDRAGDTSVVATTGVLHRGIAGLSNGRELRNAAEDAALAQTAVQYDAPQVEADAPVATAPATTAAPTTTPPTTAPRKATPPTTAAAPAVPAGIWDEIAACESGGDWAINSGNGYYGGLQFLLSTWQINGGTAFAPYPHQATREQQIIVGERVVAANGGSYGAWGACAASLGLP